MSMTTWGWAALLLAVSAASAADKRGRAGTPVTTMPPRRDKDHKFRQVVCS